MPVDVVEELKNIFSNPDLKAIIETAPFSEENLDIAKEVQESLNGIAELDTAADLKINNSTFKVLKLRVLDTPDQEYSGAYIILREKLK